MGNGWKNGHLACLVSLARKIGLEINGRLDWDTLLYIPLYSLFKEPKENEKLKLKSKSRDHSRSQSVHFE